MALRADLHIAEGLFEDAWNSVVQELGAPSTMARDLKKINYNEFIDRINAHDASYVRDFVFSFYSGSVYIFTEALDKQVLKDLKARVIEWSRSKPFTDPSPEDNAPDTITSRDWHVEDHGSGYSSTYDMIHFFRWNDDPVGAYEIFDEPFRLLHTINALGLRKDSLDSKFKKMTDRIEINHYPPLRGGIAFHHDPISFTRFTLTANLSQFGEDFKTGGFGVGIGEGKILPVEPHLDVGSLSGFLPRICHGVEIIDPYEPTHPELPESIAGRWYVAVAMVDRDKTKNREVTTSYPGYPTLREQLAAFAKEKGHMK